MSKVNKTIRNVEVDVEACYMAQTTAYGPIDYPLVTNLISSSHAGRVLDIGTGDGSFLAGLATRNKNVDFDAIDLNGNLIEQAQKKIRADEISDQFRAR